MRLILHIGTEKTATTTLQHVLSHNRAALAARGVGLSEVAGAGNNRRLAAFCQPDTMFDDFFQRHGIRTLAERQAFFEGFPENFAAEVAALKDSGAHTMVLTSEHFHSRLSTRASVQRLHDLLAPLFSDIRVLCYFREQAATAKSLYSTAIKAGRSTDLAEFLTGCTPETHRYNYFTSFSLWRDVFGAEALVARLFLRDQFVGGDILADFLDACDMGVTPDDLAPVAENQNESLGAQGLILGQIANRVLPRYRPDGSANPLRPPVMQALQDSAIAQSGTLGFDGGDEIYALFDDSNRAFAAAFLGLEDNPFPPPRAQGGAVPAITPEELADLWENLLGALAPLSVAAPGAAARLRRIARMIEEGAPVGKAEIRALREVARQIRPGGGKPDTSG